MKQISKNLYSRLKPSIKDKVNAVIKERKEENIYNIIELIILIYCAFRIILPTIINKTYFSYKIFFETVIVCIVYLIINKLFTNRRSEIKKNRDKFEKNLYVEPCSCKTRCTCKEELINYLKDIKIM